MGRQTAFPGVIVKSIEAKSGDSGKVLEFEEGLPEDIPSNRVQSFLDSIPLFGSKLTQNELVYNLEISAISKGAAHTKARAFARAKNPFEPRVAEVRNVEKLKDLGILRGGRSAYSVEVRVVK